jgi:hypothetical protein
MKRGSLRKITVKHAGKFGKKGIIAEINGKYAVKTVSGRKRGVDELK